ncbi:hypothetical protein AB0F73_26080 [Micromonospora purpureochromogenes]|uniref:hypothetical protein n=1 Tax=Micromonospora purpureochromogenes TaxID=47872 RepID=UPI00340E26D1
MGSTVEEPTPRRGRGRGWLAVLMAGVLAGGAAGVLSLRPSTDGPSAGATAPAVAPRDLLAGLPARVVPPPALADLPTERAVGPAAFLYHVDLPGGFDEATGTSRQHDIHLVTRTGQQFRVGRTPAAVGPVNQSLSPDGRWLAVRRGGQWWIRDLTDTTERAVPTGYELWRWSTDSGAVVLAELSQSTRAFAVLSMRNGSLRRLDVAATPLTDAVTLVNGRYLVLVDLTPAARGARARPELAVTVRDIDTAATRTVPVLRPGQLGPGESFNAIVPLLDGGGTPARVWVQLGRPDLQPTDLPEGLPAIPASSLIGVDVRSGEPAGRIDLSPVGTGSAELYEGIIGADVVLTRRIRERTELVAVEPGAGSRRVLTTLPDATRVLVPGRQW